MSSTGPVVRGRPRAARTIGTIYAAAAVSALLLLLFSRSRRPSLVELAFGLINVPVNASLLSAVVLGVTARALLARKRAGLVVVAAFQVIGIVLGLVTLLPRQSIGWLALWQSRTTFGRTLDVIAVAIGALALWWLWRVRGEFPGRLPVHRIGAAVLTLVGGLVLTVAVTAGLIELVEADGAQPNKVIRAVLAAFGGVTRPGHIEIPVWIVQVTATLAGLVLLAALIVLLRPGRPRSTWSPEREVEIRRLLQYHGARDSLGYLATRRDKNATFSPDGHAVLTHRAVAGISLASADPIGARESWDGAVRAWLTEAREHGLTPAALSVSEEGAKAYAAAGLRVGRMGDEAILEVGSWDLAQPSMQDIVRAVRHAKRAGIAVSFARQEELDAAQLADIARYAELWRGGEPDRGFSMALNRERDPADPRILHVLARDEHGELVGLLSFVPWGPGGVSLDVMRRSPSAPNGITELMVADLMAGGRELGVSRVSLNFCMFREVFEGADEVAANSFVRGLAVVLGHLDRFWQLERLYLFNARFQPVWVPRFYCYADPVALPQIALAAGIAEGFVPSFRKSTPPARTLDEAHLARAIALAEIPVLSGGGIRRSQQERERLRRWEAMRAAGLDPHPVGSGEPADRLCGLTTNWEAGRQVEVVARVRSIRDHGGVLFATLEDAGQQAQILLEAATGERTRMGDFRRFVDSGDLVRVHGILGSSRNGTPSILLEGWRPEAKALRPVPFGGLANPAARLRDRSADLIVHPEQADLLRARSAAMAAVRSVLGAEGYLEVDTPALQVIHGGANARPFETWSNAFGLPLYLRIAPELFLKRLLVGGLGPVFEIARNFRNEGADATHNPEFTALEAYRPFADYTTMRHLTERLVRAAALAVHGAERIPVPAAEQVRAGLAGVPLLDVSGPWAVVSVLDAVSAALGTEVTIDIDPARLIALAAAAGVSLSPRMGVGTMIEEVYGELVEPATTNPTFYVDFPQETSPLTRPHRTQPGLVERWDLVIAGMEVATAYSELTDPVDQRARFTDQSLKAAAGDVEAMQVDEDFLRALELGMPPAGGLGVGLDRLVMLLTNTPIRSVLAFPFVRPDSIRVPDLGEEETG